MRLEELSKNDLEKFADYDDHLRVVRVIDDASGLHGFIGVHNANIGPALGGCRMFTYASPDDAVRDVLRLSRGMTYKNALAGLPLGGGKSVIIGDPYKQKTPAMMQAMGRAVEALQGLYITAEDSGTGEPDMEEMLTQTSYVTGIPVPGSDLGGNPSPLTALGVYHGMKAAVRRRFGHDSFRGLTVAVQGLGAVGYALCGLLHKGGAQLIATDIRMTAIDAAKTDFPGLQIVSGEEIFTVACDIFAPCALGAQLNDQTIPKLKAAIVAGAANNQLATAAHDKMLQARGILYAPDFVVNAAGVTAVAYEYFKRVGDASFPYELNRAGLIRHIEKIGPTTARIFDIADAEKITTGQAADELAEAIFKKPIAKSSKSIAC